MDDSPKSQKTEPEEQEKECDGEEDQVDSTNDETKDPTSELRKVEFTWSRQKIFDRHAALVFLEMLKEEPHAVV